jgi:hypothetical protein
MGKMSNRKDDELEELMDKFAALEKMGWSEFPERVIALSKEMKEDHFRSICIKKALFNNSFFRTSEGVRSRGGWVSKRVLQEVLPMYPDLGDVLLWKSEIEDVKVAVLELGLYRDVSVLNKVASTGSGQPQVMAARNCDINTLRKLKGHKNYKIRKIYFERLGAVECLDEMLDDKIADIRAQGIAHSPYFYDKLKGLTKEIARYPFSQLIDKIPSDYLPMLLANRNIKNNWIARKIEKRMSKN